MTFSNFELDLLRGEANAMVADIKRQDDKAAPIMAAYRARAEALISSGQPLPPPPTEIPGMQQERTALMVRHYSKVRNLLGPDASQRLDSYLAREFAPHISMQPVAERKQIAAQDMAPPENQKTQRRASFVLAMAGVLLFGFSFLCSCRNGPEIAEYPPFINIPPADEVNEIPVILVGRVLSSSDVGKPRPSKWDGRFLTQLSEVTVAVENVMQGSVKRREIPIYYFVIASSHDGNRLLGDWKVGERYIFFLQEDSGVLRTICDNYQGCVISVLTGAHPNWKRDPKRYITDDILRFLFSRGENCGDTAMLDAINSAIQLSFGDPQYWAVKQAVEQVAIHETPTVQHGACKLLAYLGDGYFKGRAGDPLQASLRSACGSMLKDQ